MATNTPSITVITATWNAAKYLPKLIESLRNQTDKNFSWVVADGGSTDRTLELVKGAKELAAHLSSQPDFGIYDALNRAIQCTTTDYYLVVGADDWLAPDAIDNYRKAAANANEPDLVASAVRFGQVIVKPKVGSGWFYGMPGESSSHAVGLLIKRSLHEKFGMYSRRLPIAADQLFIKTVLKNQSSIVRCEFVSGEFYMHGSSGQDDWGVITELFRVQMETERWKLLQLVLLIIRCIKRYMIGLLTTKSND